MAGAMGICAALFHRERTGEGQYLESSLLQVGLAVQSYIVGRVPVYEAMVGDQIRERVREVQSAGGSYQDVLNARGDMFSALGYSAGRLYYGGYVVKDGGIILGALTPANRDQMRRAIGVDDDPTADENFDAFAPDANAKVDEVYERIRTIMLTRTMDEWIERFDAEGAPVAKVNIPDMMADDPQVQAMNYMMEVEHATTGPELMVGPAVTMAGTPSDNTLASPPLGQHTDEVLHEVGVNDAEIADSARIGRSRVGPSVRGARPRWANHAGRRLCAQPALKLSHGAVRDVAPARSASRITLHARQQCDLTSRPACRWSHSLKLRSQPRLSGSQ